MYNQFFTSSFLLIRHGYTNWTFSRTHTLFWDNWHQQAKKKDKTFTHQLVLLQYLLQKKKVFFFFIKEWGGRNACLSKEELLELRLTKHFRRHEEIKYLIYSKNLKSMNLPNQKNINSFLDKGWISKETHKKTLPSNIKCLKNEGTQNIRRARVFHIFEQYISISSNESKSYRRVSVCVYHFFSWICFLR